MMLRPSSYEFGKVIYVTNRYTVIVPIQAVSGYASGQEVHLFSEIMEYPHRRGSLKEERQDRFIGALMHTHGDIDNPPSPEDMKGIFLDEEHPDAQTSVFVISRSKNAAGKIVFDKYLIFRGNSTPQWSEEEADEHTRRWNLEQKQRIQALISPSTPLQQRIAIDSRVRAEWLLQLKRTFDLRIYLVMNGSDTAVEVIA
jgi:hypothetical protein